MATLYLTHPSGLEHATPAGHPERPDRLRAIERALAHDEFKQLETLGYEMGFEHVASGPLVRSSYHADQQAHDLVKAG